MENINNNSTIRDTVVVVGGGPVGLWTASQLKLSTPHLNVVILEKRDTYVREHTLKLDIKYMKTPRIKDARFEQIKQTINGKTPTKMLEEQLQQFAQTLKVEIKKGVQIDSLDDVFTHVPEPKIVALLGCDGRRSSVRSKIMKQYKKNEKLTAFQSIQNPIMHLLDLKNRIWAHGILKGHPNIDEESNTTKEEVFMHQLMLKYTIEGKGQPLSKMDYYRTLKLLKFPATEIVGRFNPTINQTEATCIFFLDPTTAASVKHYLPYLPGKFSSLGENENGNIKLSVDCWMNAKKELIQQKIKPDSERLVYVPISVYSACDFIDTSHSFPIALAGDSAYGVPYFKALNTGLECGTKITELISIALEENKQSKNQRMTKAFTQYQHYMADKVYTLFSHSKLKSESYSFAMDVFKMNTKLPWQFVKWSDGAFKKKLYKTFDAHPEENENYSSIKLDSKPQDYGISENEE